MTSWPYVASLASPTPYPPSPTCTHRCAHTSNRAASQVVFSWVGRTTCPNWVSYAAWSVCTSTSKAALSTFSRSCQSTSVSISTRSSTSRIRCVAEDSPKAWVTTTVSPSTVTSPCVEVGDLRAVGAVEVPGVPLHRVVGVQLEQVRRAAGRQHLAVVRLVEHAPDHAALVQLDAEVLVLEQASALVEEGR